jgi:hypothetical protein
LPPIGESHDPDDCVICGSAGLPNGIVVAGFWSPPSVPVAESAKILSITLVAQATEFLHSPRGPPMSAAECC